MAPAAAMAKKIPADLKKIKLIEFLYLATRPFDQQYRWVFKRHI
jgi:hypothetical protein